MIGSPLVGAAIAHLAFWVLLILGVVRGVLTKRAAALFVLVWVVGMGLPRIAWWAGPLVASWVAVLDIVLVFRVFKGDVRLM